jgi:hypothetical protein
MLTGTQYWISAVLFTIYGIYIYIYMKPSGKLSVLWFFSPFCLGHSWAQHYMFWTWIAKNLTQRKFVLFHSFEPCLVITCCLPDVVFVGFVSLLSCNHPKRNTQP